MAITFSSQATDLYLYAGAGLKDPVEKIVKHLSKIRAIRSPWNMAVQVKFARYNQVKPATLFFIRFGRLC